MDGGNIRDANVVWDSGSGVKEVGTQLGLDAIDSVPSYLVGVVSGVG
jgi:hypothetical protein